MKHVVSFSGGKDSTAMLLMMVEREMPIDYILFADTGKEFPQMYNHIGKVEKYINRPITILKEPNGFDYWFSGHVKTRGKNAGKCGYGWGSMRIRWCTTILKQQPIAKFLKNLGDEYQEYIGIAADEPKRIKDKNYPLVDWGITEAEALEYCYSKGFDWGGLYQNLKRVSCWCCPLKSLTELKIIYTKYPELWKQLKQMDNEAYNQFRPDYSVQELEERFQKEIFLSK